MNGNETGRERLVTFKKGLACRSKLLTLWPLIACLAVAGRARADKQACLGAHEQAQLERMGGHHLEARQHLIACAQNGCPGVIREDCKLWLEQVERSVSSVVFAVSDESGRDLVDARVSTAAGLLIERSDGRAIEINPGVYSLRVEAPGFAPVQQQLSVREGEKQRLVRVVLRAAASAGTAKRSGTQAEGSAAETRARRLMLSGYVLAGVGLASLATGIGLGAAGKQDVADLKHQDCKPECDRGEVAAGRRKYLVANVSFAAAAALLGAAAFTWIWAYRKQREAQPAHAPALSFAADNVGVSLSGSMRF